MKLQAIAILLSLVLLAEPVMAARRAEVSVSWSGLGEQVAQRSLNKHRITIFLTDGKKSYLHGIEEDGIVVEANTSTKRWKSDGKNVKVPRISIAAVRLAGSSRGALIGLLVGLGVAVAAIGAYAASDSECEGIGCGMVLLLAPPLGVIEYYIGKRTDKPVPDFRIVQ